MTAFGTNCRVRLNVVVTNQTLNIDSLFVSIDIIVVLRLESVPHATITFFMVTAAIKSMITSSTTTNVTTTFTRILSISIVLGEEIVVFRNSRLSTENRVIFLGFILLFCSRFTSVFLVLLLARRSRSSRLFSFLCWRKLDLVFKVVVHLFLREYFV